MYVKMTNTMIVRKSHGDQLMKWEREEEKKNTTKQYHHHHHC